MYAIDLGLFPFVGLALGGLLYAVYHFVLRLKCPASEAQAFILVSMLSVTLCSLVSISTITPPDTLASLSPRTPEGNVGVGIASPGATTNATQASNPIVNDAVAPYAPFHGNSIPQANSLLSIFFSNLAAVFGGVYLIGFLVTLAYFTVQICYLYLFRKRQKAIDNEKGALIYETEEMGLPFSFGHYVFLPSALTGAVRQHVLTHELSHVRHHHFLWLCLAELIGCVNWYNPFVWLFFREMRLQQELEVDTDVMREGIDRVEYQMSLLSISTKQGKWILTQHAFFGEPLKKRLLFMNTPINTHRAAMKLAFASFTTCLLLATLAVFSCQTRQKEQRHPLQGCWIMESHHHSDNSNIWPIFGSMYKFYGDYGELVLNLTHQKGINLDFMFSGMEQKVQGDRLTDKHGNPIEYSLDNGVLTWHWPEMEPGKDNVHPKGLITIEKWHRSAIDTHVVDLIRTICTPTQTQGSHGMNGVWELDSLKLVEPTTADVCNLDRDFLIIHDNIYMRVTYVTENIDNPYIDFKLGGDTGEFSINDKGEVILQKWIYDMKPQNDKDHIVLYMNPAKYPSLKDIGILLYYRRTEMPDFLPRLLKPMFLD
ncbi:MAG: M56 family metallopeptidase [Prevotella sp.]|nr:M56 family metallopeptidase [Prevotella sp.]